MFTAVWLKRARLPEVSLALTYEQHGFFEQAQLAYEQVDSSFISSVIIIADVIQARRNVPERPT